MPGRSGSAPRDGPKAAIGPHTNCAGQPTGLVSASSLALLAADSLPLIAAGFLLSHDPDAIFHPFVLDQVFRWQAWRNVYSRNGKIVRWLWYSTRLVEPPGPTGHSFPR